MAHTAAVITVSDKGSKGQRVDTSGPALCEMLKEKGWEIAYTSVIPDEREQICGELLKCSDDLKISLILTTGGTGFSPRDVTPEATLSVLERETPGIPEAMRAESMKITPRGCLSRSAAGIRGRSLIVNLPGSEKAAKENLQAVLDPIRHGVEMLLSSGSADCGVPVSGKKQPPSIDQWLKEAKASPDADKIGMYLTHNGVVRRTAKAELYSGQAEKPVEGMVFSYDADKLATVIDEAKKMEGIYYVRVWLNEGELQVGEDIMYALIGGDIRSHTLDALQQLVGRIKEDCVIEKEI